MSNKELQAQLAQLVSAAHAALSEAESFAAEHNLDFSFSPEYGMGGHYDGAEAMWYPSSQSC